MMREEKIQSHIGAGVDVRDEPRRGVRESEIYKALSSSSRLKILKLFYKQALSVDDMAQKADLRPVTARHHLKILERAGNLYLLARPS